MTSLDILRQQLAEVAKRRAERDALTAEVKEAREAFEASIADKTARLKGLSEGVAMSEEAARIAGIAAYTADKSIGKKPVDGITLQDGTLYTYNKADALAWAKEKQMCVIPEQLDVAAVTIARVAWILSRELHTREHAAEAVATRPALHVPVEGADPLPPSRDWGDYNAVWPGSDGTNGYRLPEDRADA